MKLVVVLLAGALVFPALAGAVTTEERAAATYERVWGRADVWLGAEGQPPPLVRFNEPGLEQLAAVRRENGRRVVLLGPEETGYLGRPLGPKGSGIRANRRYGKFLLYHEWGHVFQDPAVLKADPVMNEGGADLFAARVAQSLDRNKRTAGTYPAEQAAFRARFGEEFAMREQFGVNWGKNPREIG